jgi:hypothetical protein
MVSKIVLPDLKDIGKSVDGLREGEIGLPVSAKAPCESLLFERWGRANIQVGSLNVLMHDPA